MIADLVRFQRNEAMTLREFIGKLGFDRAYEQPTGEIAVTDLQGWGSDQPIFKKMIDLVRPKEIIEVGSWKGASAIHMTQLAKSHFIDVTTVCVDTFLGSNAIFWTDTEYSDALKRDEYGLPTLYPQFLYNVSCSGLSPNMFPLPMTSTCAAEVMQHYGVQADLIYIDGGHREFEVSQDLHDYWLLLRPGGILLCDDYSADWPGVVAALDKFAGSLKLSAQTEGNKWWMRKPSKMSRGELEGMVAFLTSEVRAGDGRMKALEGALATAQAEIRVLQGRLEGLEAALAAL